MRSTSISKMISRKKDANMEIVRGMVSKPLDQCITSEEELQKFALGLCEIITDPANKEIQWKAALHAIEHIAHESLEYEEIRSWVNSVFSDKFMAGKFAEIVGRLFKSNDVDVIERCARCVQALMIAMGDNAGDIVMIVFPALLKGIKQPNIEIKQSSEKTITTIIHHLQDTVLLRAIVSWFDFAPNLI